MITETVLITLNKSFVICELYLWHMKNFEIKKQKVPTLNEIPGSASAPGLTHFPILLLSLKMVYFFVTKKLLRPKWRDPETHVAKLEPYVLQLLELELG